jgi:hypothetical protein
MKCRRQSSTDPVHVLTARPLVRHSLVGPLLSTDGLVDPGFVLDARLIIANIMDQIIYAHLPLATSLHKINNN